MTIYHEKQIGNYCRCHAINNLVGKQICSTQEFNRLCDEFDKKNGFTTPSSKLKYLFYNNGGTENIFGYILQKKGYTIKMTHYDYYRTKAIKLRVPMLSYDSSCNPPTKSVVRGRYVATKPHSGTPHGFIVYNRSHTFCVRKIGNEFHLIDSLRRTIQKINPLVYCKRRNLGVICIESI